jgi:RimJ/RimL family protein N-acetyltransferase
MTTVQLDTKTSVQVRPIEVSDRAALAAAFARLSPASRLRRFLSPKSTLSDGELTRLTEVDHVTHEALVAIDRRRDIVGVARYAAGASLGTAEVAVVVADSWQRRGLGSALTARVIAHAKKNGFAVLTADTFWENLPARALIAQLGFRRAGGSGAVASYRLEVGASHPPALTTRVARRRAATCGSSASTPRRGATRRAPKSRGALST